MRHVFSKVVIVFVLILVLGVSVEMVYSHCQIPCGIYTDQGRFDQMSEDILTIEKSMKEITSLSGSQKKDMNQIVRWVNNKDHHADKLSETVTYYFMAQRIKPVEAAKGKTYDKYVREITLLHRMLVHSMKAKQTTDKTHVAALRSLLGEFEESYLSAKAQ